MDWSNICNNTNNSLHMFDSNNLFNRCHNMAKIIALTKINALATFIVLVKILIVKFIIIMPKP